MKALIFSLFIAVISLPVYSQTNGNHSSSLTDNSKKGKGVTVVAEPEIEAMVAEHIRLNKGEGVLAGYRIQLMSSPEVSRVQNEQAAFAARYPGFSTRVVHESPNFKLRVGGFDDRFKAYQALQQLVLSYSGAFIVKDLIRVSEL